MKNNLELVGEWDGWKVHKNADGFYEAYKKSGKGVVIKVKANEEINLGTDCKRVVTNAKNMSDFISYMNGLKKKKVKDIQLKPHQLPSLFSNE